MKKVCLIILLVFILNHLEVSSLENKTSHEFTPNYKYAYRKAYFINDFNLYFTNPKKNYYPQNTCESDNCKALLKLIRTSQKNIDFAIYGFQD